MHWHTITVAPALPEKLKPLGRLARNLWYTWHPEGIELWRRLDRDLWEEVHHNPVRLLGSVPQHRLEEAARNESFLLHMERIMEDLELYMESKTPYSFHLEKGLDPSFRVAYFSMEYGLNEALPIYSGGLGILSGDHLKSASNLNLPLVGMGLLYQKGYFGQYLNAEGWQQEYYADNDFVNMSISQERDEEGNPVQFPVGIGDRTVNVAIWRVQVGRVPLFMLDTNLPENGPEDRKITVHLYGGDRDMRMRQEILLGMGGILAMETLGVEAKVFHMNEGHSAFAGLERIRRLVQREGLSFHSALEVVRASTVFTTHTPVPAGNDYFAPDLMERYFRRYADEMGISFHDFLGLGRINPHDHGESFCMTALAIRSSNHRNGVSELHREVSQGMWQGIWPGLPKSDVPIGSVTNGVHIPSYISKELSDLFYRYLGPTWVEDPDNQKVWERVERIPDTELWRTHERRRERLIAFARRRVREQLTRRGALPSELKEAEDILNPGALTICFARRFATYKRGDLLFSDPKRLARILNDPERPVQILYAGKAHPQDKEGKAIIKNIIQHTHEKAFRYNVAFLEDYDINVARYLVQGADVWLNTPRRPLEACGTSGMKAVANGALHMSILDGWWAEGYTPRLGWAVGAGEEYEDDETQDEIEGRAVYDLLEREVIPLFYDRSRDGTPRRWIEMVKASMRWLCPVFNTHRMLEDYAEKFYIPAFGLYQEIQREMKQNGEAIVGWKRKMHERWGGISVQGVELGEPEGEYKAGSAVDVRARVFLGGLEPDDVQVDLYFGPLNGDGGIEEPQTESMRSAGKQDDNGYIYRGRLLLERSGRFGFALRVLPKHAFLVHPVDMGLVYWG